MTCRFKSLKIIITLTLPLFSLLGCTAYKLATGDFTEMQERVDLLEEKAAAGREFTNQDKEFLTDLYRSLVTGGRLLGYREAADMLGRYLAGTGEPLRIEAEVYLQNAKVATAMKALKVKISSDIKNKTPRVTYVSADILISPQENPRLFYFSNFFHLQAKPVKIENVYCHILWKVELTAHFQSYAEQKQRYGDAKYFKTPFTTNRKGQTFTIDDGLSHHLLVLGLAREFTYFAEWTSGF